MNHKELIVLDDKGGGVGSCMVSELPMSTLGSAVIAGYDMQVALTTTLVNHIQLPVKNGGSAAAAAAAATVARTIFVAHLDFEFVSPGLPVAVEFATLKFFVSGFAAMMSVNLL